MMSLKDILKLFLYVAIYYSALVIIKDSRFKEVVELLAYHSMQRLF